ncbi:MAG: glutamate--tRNA ligase [Acholeplasmataceae bacterium]
MSKVRVRYAPSPTGLLHIGNARSALFNYLYARHFKGDFIVRIEDTDVLRNVEGGEASQLDYLKWLGLAWDESPDMGGAYGPYRQLERLNIYQDYANQLLEKGLAYKDFKEGSDTYAIRFKVPELKTYAFDDLVRGHLSFESKDVEDWIILKDNGIPTYNFAVVIDDHLMAITHVLRGEEHITNTPKQLMVYEAFDWQPPKFGHMTIIVNEQKKKLSKRDQNVIQFISEYADMGYLPEAMFNFISLLGWSPESDQEILTQEEIIALFNPSRLSKAPAMFDKDKLAYINSRYIKMLDVKTLASMARPYLLKDHIEIQSDLWLELLVSVLQDRMTHIGQITTLHRAFFHQDFNIEAEALQFLKDNQSLTLLDAFYQNLQSVEWTQEAIEQLIKDTGKTVGVKGKPLFMGLRIATTGDMHGPSLPISITLLGKPMILNRIKYTMNQLRGENK